MDFTKRYYSLREAADALGIPIHQARRWIRQFLPSPRRGRIRLSQKDFERLQLIYQGFYGYRLRGKALKAFLQSSAAQKASLEPYAVLREVYKRLKALEARLDSFMADFGEGAPPQGV